MTQTTAKIRKGAKHFEIIVDLDRALAFKKGESDSVDFLETDTIFTDSKKGFVAGNDDMKEAFKTTDVNEIAKKIVKQGELLVTHEHRDEEQEKRFKQVVNFLVKNALDPKTGNPHTEERIKSALEQARVNIKRAPIENQIAGVVDELSKVLPIRISTKKVKIKIPAVHTGKAYGIINQYKEKENWLSNGDLEVVVNVPAGAIMDFYDRLNNITHGSAITEEIKIEESEKD